MRNRPQLAPPRPGVLGQPLPAAGCARAPSGWAPEDPGDNAHLASPHAGTQSTILTWKCEVPCQNGSTSTATLTRQLLPLHPSHSSPRRLWVRTGLGKDTGSWGQPPLRPHSAPNFSQLYTPEKLLSSPAFNSSEWRSTAGTSLPLSPCPVPCPRPAKRHAPRSP